MSKGALVDLTRCTGCRACQVACKAWNDNPAEMTLCVGCYDNPAELSADTWTLIRFTELEEEGDLHWVFTKRQCMHCEEPGCVSACPVGALQKTESGAVVYLEDICIGCRYCMVACPFRVPKLQWYRTLPLIQKCTFCFDRQSNGETPACLKTCPTNALQFGEREALLAEARARIQARPDSYVNHIYGEHEVGGTSWMYLSPVPFEKLGFPSLGEEAVTEVSESVVGVVPFGLGAVAVGVSAVAWFMRRRDRLMAEARTSQEGKEA